MKSCKLFFLLLFSLIPVILFLKFICLPQIILEKTPLYKKPLNIIQMWVADDLQKISDNNKGERTFEVKFKDGQKSTVKVNSPEAIYMNVLDTQEKIFIKTDRPMEDKKEERNMGEEINRLLSLKTYTNKEIRQTIKTPQGYREPINISCDSLSLLGNIINGISIVLIAIFCLALYYPITKGMIKLFKNRKEKATA